jgi:hypothetical protein
MSVYRTPASGVFRRKGFGFATCDNNRASVSQFVARIGQRSVRPRGASGKLSMYRLNMMRRLFGRAI